MEEELTMRDAGRFAAQMAQEMGPIVTSPEEAMQHMKQCEAEGLMDDVEFWRGYLSAWD